MKRQTTLRLTKFEAKIFAVLLHNAKYDLAEDHSNTKEQQSIIFNKLNELQTALETASADNREKSRFYGVNFTRSLHRYSGIKVPVR